MLEKRFRCFIYYLKNRLLRKFKNKYLTLLSIVFLLWLFNYFHIDGKEKVNQISNPTTYYFLIIAIVSDPNESHTRDVIRQTWLKLFDLEHLKTRYLFMIGTQDLPSDKLAKLKHEHDVHMDLVFLEDHLESYNNLTRKTAAVLRNIDENYIFDYVLKVDSDSFVNIKSLIKLLEDIGTPKLYLGYLDGQSPIRKAGRNKEADWNFCDLYLPYHAGGGYVLGRDLVKFVSINFHILKFYKNEDAALATWIAGLDVKTVHDVRFDTQWDSRGCLNDYIVTHKKDPQDLEALYNNLVYTGKLCDHEYVRRAAYEYDYNAPPSKCCKNLIDAKFEGSDKLSSGSRYRVFGYLGL